MLLFEHGVSAEDFFVYHFYEKKRRERAEFVTLAQSQKIIKLLNRNCKRELVENKSIFGKKFCDLLERNQISSTGLSYDDFKNFYFQEKRIIVKPSFGCNGDGIFIVEENADENRLKSVYDTIKSAPYVIETVLVQEGILKELNPKTLNTVRVNVLNNHGDMMIVNAILRSGQGDVVTDNICAGGCVTEIDVESGRFISKFVDLSNHIYDVHPLSKVSLYGKTMPCWDKVKKIAIKATERLDGVVYASWDIAVIKGGKVAVVEGNTYGNFNIQQVPRQQGLLSFYKKFIKEWKQREKNN